MTANTRFVSRGLVLFAGIALSGTCAVSASAQPAVADGTYAVYSFMRETNQFLADQEFFLQTFAVDGTTTIINHTFRQGVPDGERVITETPFLCEGTYSPTEPFEHIQQATCGADTYFLMPTHFENIDGRLVVTEMIGTNGTRGSSAGERIEFRYVRLPDGFEEAVIMGTYVTAFTEAQINQLHWRSYFAPETFAPDGTVTYYDALRSTPGEEPGTRTIEEIQGPICQGVYIQNGLFVGVHQKTCGNGIWDLLPLRMEELDGLLVVTEFIGFGRGYETLESATIRYWRVPR